MNQTKGMHCNALNILEHLYVNWLDMEQRDSPTLNFDVILVPSGLLGSKMTEIQKKIFDWNSHVLGYLDLEGQYHEGKFDAMM